MKTYVKIIDGQVVAYPYSLAQLRKDNPNVSFPAQPSDEDLVPFGVFPVVPASKPVFDPLTQRLAEGNPELAEGQWVSTYIVVDMPEADIHDALMRLRGQITEATQQRLDNFSATRGYDSVISAAKYKDISDEEIDLMPADERPLVRKFRTEARYLAAATARTWAKLYLFLGQVEAGLRQPPTSFADIEPELPVLEWPANA